MTATSRPLRALGLVLGGWATIRIVALWPMGNAAEIATADRSLIPILPPLIAVPLDTRVPFYTQRRSVAGKMATDTRHRELVSGSTAKPGPPAHASAWLLKHVPHDDNRLESADQTETAVTRQAIAPGLPLTTPHNRFSGSAWSLLRNESGPSLASGGQLGGSQVGFRMFYTPGSKALALTARISAPLSQPTGREVAIGVALRGHNIGIIAEQRLALDKGGRNAPAVFAYGGAYNVKLSGGLKLDGYAQAGIVGIKSVAAFVDGAVRVERTVLKAGKASLAIGAGLWGGAQPGVSRIDVGPQIAMRLAVAETNLRVSADWRQRIAGDAAPSSGPSVTVGFDF
jgi:hypothetical protein